MSVWGSNNHLKQSEATPLSSISTQITLWIQSESCDFAVLEAAAAYEFCVNEKQVQCYNKLIGLQKIQWLNTVAKKCLCLKDKFCTFYYLEDIPI